MVNTALRRAGRDHARFQASVCPRALGDPLPSQRHFYVAYFVIAVSHDYLSTRHTSLHEGRVVANRRSGSGRALDCSFAFPEFALARACDRQSLSSTARSVSVNRPRLSPRIRLQVLGVFMLLGLGTL